VNLTTLIEQIGFFIEAMGVFVVVAGIGYSVIRLFFTVQSTDRYQDFRRNIGRSLMLGLEFLVAGDIIRTVVISHSMSDVAALGLLVLVRTVLVFTIHLEVEGRWPWQQKQA